MSHDTNPSNDKQIECRKNCSNFIYATFFWCMIGVSITYRVRLWLDTPIYPSFLLPLVGAIFAAVLTFTLVISLEYVVGPIILKSKSFAVRHENRALAELRYPLARESLFLRKLFWASLPNKQRKSRER
jgi:hypothetical protein